MGKGSGTGTGTGAREGTGTASGHGRHSCVVIVVPVFENVALGALHGVGEEQPGALNATVRRMLRAQDRSAGRLRHEHARRPVGERSLQVLENVGGVVDLFAVDLEHRQLGWRARKEQRERGRAMTKLVWCARKADLACRAGRGPTRAP